MALWLSCRSTLTPHPTVDPSPAAASLADARTGDLVALRSEVFSELMQYFAQGEKEPVENLGDAVFYGNIAE